MTWAEQWIALTTLVRKESVRFLRIWIQTLVPPVVTMSLYFVIFGSLIGSRIGTIQGFDYMAFIVPGLIMMAVITNTYMNSCSSFFSSKFQRSVEELLVSPTPPWVIVAGYVLGAVLRGLLVAVLVMGVALFFTRLQVASAPVLIYFIVMTAILFSTAGLLNAIFAGSFDDVNIVPTFVLTPLTYLGGVFYSLDQLSPVFQTVSRLNPILYMVNGFRYGFLGISDVGIGTAAMVLFVLTAAVCVITWWTVRRGTGLRT